MQPLTFLGNLRSNCLIMAFSSSFRISYPVTLFMSSFLKIKSPISQFADFTPILAIKTCSLSRRPVKHFSHQKRPLVTLTWPVQRTAPNYKKIWHHILISSKEQSSFTSGVTEFCLFCTWVEVKVSLFKTTWVEVMMIMMMMIDVLRPLLCTW